MQASHHKVEDCEQISKGQMTHSDKSLFCHFQERQIFQSYMPERVNIQTKLGSFSTDLLQNKNKLIS